MRRGVAQIRHHSYNNNDFFLSAGYTVSSVTSPSLRAVSSDKPDQTWYVRYTTSTMPHTIICQPVDNNKARGESIPFSDRCHGMAVASLAHGRHRLPAVMLLIVRLDGGLGVGRTASRSVELAPHTAVSVMRARAMPICPWERWAPTPDDEYIRPDTRLILVGLRGEVSTVYAGRQW